MTLAVLVSRANRGIESPQVTVEVHQSNGLSALSMVGLPDKAVQESKDRVRGALLNSHFEFPMQRLTINLAPADLPKDGGRFDLSIALGILVASEQITLTDSNQYEFLGELALSGEIRPVHAVLPAALACKKAGRILVLPIENAPEAGLIKDLTIIPVQSLIQICGFLTKQTPIESYIADNTIKSPLLISDLQEVKGQQYAKRALEIVASGGHSLIMSGPPGSGKSMLASRLAGILPPMTEQEALETAAIHSISDIGLNTKAWRIRPFRAPHHTASGVALVGGGSNPRPGEVSLAHNGVLFLDELPEFNRQVLEVLREPLESGHIIISRAGHQADFPAQFQLVAAMNPCPCGHLGESRCHCSPMQIDRYKNRISGPLMDRIDLQIQVPALPPHELSQMTANGETSQQVRERVYQTRLWQLKQYGKAVATFSNRDIDQYCQISPEGISLLIQSIEKLNLSARAYHRILKVARTIADMQQNEMIQLPHLSEAVNYRRVAP